jgi:hypothetical protein
MGTLRKAPKVPPHGVAVLKIVLAAKKLPYISGLKRP